MASALPRMFVERLVEPLFERSERAELATALLRAPEAPFPEHPAKALIATWPRISYSPTLPFRRWQVKNKQQRKWNFIHEGREPQAA